MLHTAEITSKKFKDFRAVANIYTSAFPPSGQAPMWFLLHRAKKTHIKFNAYYDGERVIGLAYFVVYARACYVVRLAVDTECQSKGYGSQLLDSIKAAYPNNRIILAIEMEDENADNNEQRKKRRQFYLRNGFVSTGISSELKGVTYDLLVCNGECTPAEFFVLYKKFLGAIVFAFLKPRLVSLT